MEISVTRKKTPIFENIYIHNFFFWYLKSFSKRWNQPYKNSSILRLYIILEKWGKEITLHNIRYEFQKVSSSYIITFMDHKQWYITDIYSPCINLNNR